MIIKSGSFLHTAIEKISDLRLMFDLSRLPIGREQAVEQIRAYNRTLRAYQTVMQTETTGAASLMGMATSNVSLFVTGGGTPCDWKSFSEIVRLGREMYDEVTSLQPFDNEIDIKSGVRITEACDDFLQVVRLMPDEIFPMIDRRSGPANVQNAFIGIMPKGTVVITLPPMSRAPTQP